LLLLDYLLLFELDIGLPREVFFLRNNCK